MTEQGNNNGKQATSLILLGMAGSGKSTLMQRINAHLRNPRKSNDKSIYSINLDPAVREVNYKCNIDIRDTVDYKEVMKQYNLGPNGGIMTSLNLFTTKFDQVLGLISKRKDENDYILIDTPGQIEIFTWSASGAIITDAIASEIPTVIGFVIDTPRTMAPATFMSNMLYACSILYKTRLPLLLIFNKTDVEPHDFAIEWMQDFEKFQEALQNRPATQTQSSSNLNDEPSYMNSLMNSMSLVLEEFYKNIKTAGVSAMTGDGIDELFKAVDECKVDYENDYKVELDRLRNEREEKKKEDKERSLKNLMKDMKDMKVNNNDKDKDDEELDQEDIDENDIDNEEIGMKLPS